MENWRHWARSEWNDALVSAVFTARDNLATPITRIDTTSKFLRNVAGDPSADPKEIRSHFVNLFKGNVWEVRRQFDYRRQTYLWFPFLSELPFFAQLYLTLLVSSADEGTHDIGDFRRRFVKLLGLPSDSSWPLGGIPELWRAAESWSRQTIRKDTRQLILPDPGIETIIGYSKRLAFPSYRDQVQLAALLTSKRLNEESPFARINKEVLGFQRRFSPRFLEEYRLFKSLVDSGDRKRAIQTPFWGALQDTAWEHDSQPAAQTDESRFLLELDVSDPYCPNLLLLTNKPISESSQEWRSERRRHLIGEHKYELVSTGGAGSVANKILNLQSTRHLLRDQNIVSGLEEGILLFAQDELGRWVTTPKSIEGPFWIVCRDHLWNRIGEALRRAKSAATFHTNIPDAAGWGLIGSLTMTEAIRAMLRACLPEHDSFDLHLMQPRIRLRNALVLPEGTLFLARLLPYAAREECDSMTWSVTLDTGEIRGPYEMIPRNQAGSAFEFSKSEVDEIAAPAEIELNAVGSDGRVIERKRFRTTPACHGMDYRQVNDLKGWLETGANGQMVPALGEPRPGRIQDASSSPDVRPLVRETFSAPEVIRTVFDQIPKRFVDLLEILVAGFSRAATISLPDFFDITQRVCDLDSRATWMAIQGLIDNGVIRHLHSRRWHGTCLMAVRPLAEVTAVDDRVTLRVTGLVSASFRRQLEHVGRAFGAEVVTLASMDGSSIGRIELGLASPQEAERFAQRMDLPLRVNRAPGIEGILGWREIFATGNDQPTGDVSIWDESAACFVDRDLDQSLNTKLQRWKTTGQQPLYVLTHGFFTWTTRSRHWALMARRALVQRRIGGVNHAGGVRLDSSEYCLPPVVAAMVVRHGAGAVVRDAAGRAYYGPGRAWSPANSLTSWICDGIYGRQDIALERLQTARSRKRPHAHRRMSSLETKLTR